jgi:hypothetical protein
MHSLFSFYAFESSCQLLLKLNLILNRSIKLDEILVDYLAPSISRMMHIPFQHIFCIF